MVLVRKALPLLFAALTACGGRQTVPTSDAPAPSPAWTPERVSAEQRTPPTLRLPTVAKPTGYTAELTIDPRSPNFHGRMEVALEVTAPTDVLWLHGEGLTVKEASLVRDDGQSVALVPMTGGADFLGFALAEKLGPGAATLRLAYEGVAPEHELAGAFRVKEGEDWYVFTQFEALGARKVFPCFDEPGFKVPWQLTLHVPSGNTAVTNTPVLEESEREGGLRTFRFARTQPLPSYLIALGVGPFDFLDAGASGHKQVATRIITPRGRAGEGAYAAKVTPELLARLEGYFGMPYPYEKLDVMAVPLFGGAMEHPGLVTFNANLLLAKEGEDSVERQRDFARTQIHELAHQWFGDLVTLAWWDDLWLNEAFATWMTPRIEEDWRPAWDAPVERVLERSGALTLDGYVSARRIRQPIETQGDIENAFDGITYGKGAAVLAMTEAWLGRDVFQRGIQRYLRAHAGGNAKAGDFLAALSAEAGSDVGRVLSTFLDQGGAPLVTAELDCAGKVPAVKLAQRRYLPVGSRGSAAQLWKVPLCVRYGVGRTEARACTVLESETAVLPLPEAKRCPDWLYPNADGAGYLRAQVVGAGSERMVEAALPRLSRAERVALLGDTLALVKAGALPAADALALVPRFAEEKDRVVLGAALELLEVLSPRLLPEARLAERARFLRDTFAPRALRLGLLPRPGEDEDTRLVRQVLTRLAGQDGQDAKLVAQARALVEKWLVDSSALPRESMDSVLVIAANSGDAALHARMLAAVRTQEDRRVRQQLYFGLGSFLEPALARENLKLLLEPETDLREAWPLLFIAANDVRTQAVAYAFVKEHYEALTGRMPAEFHARLAWVGANFCDAESRADVAAFFSERNANVLGGQRMLEQVLESVDLCMAMKEAQGASVEAFLLAPRKTPRAPAKR